MLTTFGEPIVCHFGPYSPVQYQRKNDLRPREKNKKEAQYFGRRVVKFMAWIHYIWCFELIKIKFVIIFITFVYAIWIWC